MARERNPERDKARRIWLDSGGTLTARQVAEQVGVKPEQVRKWKALIAGRRNLKRRNHRGSAADNPAIRTPQVQALHTGTETRKPTAHIQRFVLRTSRTNSANTSKVSRLTREQICFLNCNF